MLTVQQAKKELKVGIASYLFKDASGNYVLPIEFDAKEFLDYGAEIGIHSIILEYLRIHKNHVYLYHDKTEFVTVRG